MGLPTEYDHPTQAIFDRTLNNLNFIRSNQDTAYVFEFTALINSMLGIFVHPWDQLLNKGKLESLKWDHPKVKEWGFRPYATSRPHLDDPRQRSRPGFPWWFAMSDSQRSGTRKHRTPRS